MAQEQSNEMLIELHEIESRGDDNNPVKSLVRLLKNELGGNEWTDIGLRIQALQGSISFHDKMMVLVQEGIISKDITQLIQLMSDIKRNDLVQSVMKLHARLMDIPGPSFLSRFVKEVLSLEEEISKWKESLKYFIELQNRKVKQLFDDEELVVLESVYVPLTIIWGKPEPVNPKDETTYNEIALMRKIAKEDVGSSHFNFEENLKKCNPSKPQIWCVLGNPGSGKSYLCHKTALRFGKGELTQFAYCLTIPCRNEDWHQMERDNASKAITGDFIQKWLCLSMPVGSSWTSDLSKHILDTDGEGLLLIIDSLDEFTKEVPFQRTLLSLLLSRSCLHRSTILLTSRPGAYTVISTSHTLLIYRFFQVLGFSPENRDLYFSKQLTDVTKQDELKRLIELHDEINQLSLIPVNASLFAALVRGSDNVSAHTLTRLYSELVCYLIRRQLFRMGLKELAKRKTLFQLHSTVLDCLFRIGELAYMGVSTRELISSEDILLRVEKEEKSCQCLGLAEEHLKKDELGGITRVWSYAHLTLQEFVGAVWLRMCSWGDQCLSTRYIVHSKSNFSMFRMVVRFLCGMLSNSAIRVLFILYKYYLRPSPMPMQEMPMCFQFNFDWDYNSRQAAPEYPTTIPGFMKWIEFTIKFATLSEMLFESDYHSISHFRHFLPKVVYFYLGETFSPNEWQSFLRSLPLLHSIELIYFKDEFVTPLQFTSLLLHLTSCSLNYLAIRIERDSDLSLYCDAIRESQLSSDTKISLDLACLDLFESADQVDTNVFQLFSSLSLYETTFPSHIAQQIANQLTSLHLFRFFKSDDFSDWDILLSGLTNATQLTALHIEYSYLKDYSKLETILPRLTNLQELSLFSRDSYLLLPYISDLYLKYIHIGSISELDSFYLDHLLDLLYNSSESLRGLDLCFDGLYEEPIPIVDELLRSLHYCVNLVEIRLNSTECI